MARDVVAYTNRAENPAVTWTAVPTPRYRLFGYRIRAVRNLLARLYAGSSGESD